MKDYPSTCRSWNRFVSVFLAHFCAGKETVEIGILQSMSKALHPPMIFHQHWILS